MAKKTEVLAAQTATQEMPQLSLIPLVLAVTAAVVVSVALCAAAGFWMIHSGRIAIAAGIKPVQAASRVGPAPTHLVALDPLLVNLADEDGHAYLRVSLTLVIEDQPSGMGEKGKQDQPSKGRSPNEFEAAERDAALSVLGRQTSSDLLAESGKERLKQQLKTAFAEHVAEVKVQQILLTEFLVQH